MIPLLATLAAAHSFEQPSRWLVRSEVALPAVMWMAADRNAEARMLGWRVALVLDCDPAPAARRAVEVRCRIDDASLSAAPHPSDAGLLGPILVESRDRLRGATVEMRFGRDGALQGVLLDGLPTLRRRQTAMNENLRLVVSRAVAGFDLPRPARDGDDAWFRPGGWIAQLPAAAGTLAGGEVWYRATPEANGTRTIAARGKVVLEPHARNDWPPTAVNRTVHRIEGPLPPSAWWSWSTAIGMVAWFDTAFDATATVDAATGAIRERRWTAVGAPTPSARVAHGAEGYPYVQRGRLARLDAEASPALGDSVELEPPRSAPTALQSWEILGALW